ncbi:hypothetical protein ATCC90586_007319 [Pythium insidiosum]|nr:hypothetical protein ATCC90586_007319 [Pythium insidiosum]
MSMTMLSALRRVRQFSTAAGRTAAGAGQKATRQAEYPSSFISHLRTQKMNMFNIGVVFLALSLSSQIVSYKQQNTQLTEDNAALTERVAALEELVVSLGGSVPTPVSKEELSKEAEAAEAARVKREREDEARALTAAANDEAAPKKKSLLI